MSMLTSNTIPADFLIGPGKLGAGVQVLAHPGRRRHHLDRPVRTGQAGLLAVLPGHQVDGCGATATETTPQRAYDVLQAAVPVAPQQADRDQNYPRAARTPDLQGTRKPMREPVLEREG